MIARVAVSAALYAIDKPYSYVAPPELGVQPGMRVLVPFGRGNRMSESVVLQLDTGEEAKLKCIERCLDDEPVLSERQLRLAAFIRDVFLCLFYV